MKVRITLHCVKEVISSLGDTTHIHNICGRGDARCPQHEGKTMWCGSKFTVGTVQSGYNQSAIELLDGTVISGSDMEIIE